MNELAKLTKGGVSAAESGSEQRQKALSLMRERLGIKLASEKAPSILQSQLKLIVLLFDATSSMSNVWQEAKNGIDRLISRLGELFPGVRLAMIAFRDYCDDNEIIETIEPTSDAKKLKTFLGSVACRGGGDLPEAVEIALERLLELAPDLGILVGDAPPHGVDDSLRAGKDFREIAGRLGQKKTPVYTVSTNDLRSTISSFEEIARLSGGKFFKLDQLDALTDILSAAAAKQARQIPLLAEMMKKENKGGQLTKRQEKLLLEAAR